MNRNDDKVTAPLAGGGKSAQNDDKRGSSDRGLPRSVGPAKVADLPNEYPGTTLKAMAREPGLVFVYWEADGAEDSYDIIALGHAEQLLASFETQQAKGHGYLQVDLEEVSRIELRPSSAYRPLEVTRVIGTGGVDVQVEALMNEETWVSHSTGEAVTVAPAEGHAPEEDHHAPGSLPSSRRA